MEQRRRAGPVLHECLEVNGCTPAYVSHVPITGVLCTYLNVSTKVLHAFITRIRVQEWRAHSYLAPGIHGHSGIASHSQPFSIC